MKILIYLISAILFISCTQSKKNTGGAISKTRTLRSQSSKPKGRFIHPVPNNSWISQKLHGKNAIDFAAPKGTAILASAPGKVIRSDASGHNGGYGKVVVIKHPDGTETLYAHMSRIKVRLGKKVKRGEVIGYVGSTGRSTGNHLHFEVHGASNPFNY